MGATSRLLRPDSGAEVARLSVAQRWRLQDQRVTLTRDEKPASDGLSDVLIGGFVQLTPRWRWDSAVQFNPSTQRSEQSVLSTVYKPSDYRVLSGTYRYQRESSEQVDVGWQWPLNDLWGDKGQDLGSGRGQGEGRWYSVGRLNYSLKEAKMVSSIVGFEYDAGCWIGRIVLEHQQTSLRSANQSIMFQLEFVGFSRLGVSPLKTLKDNVPNYQYLRTPQRSVNRFSHYD
jgi:LPS-assembly protein